jgi:hypothetical protein
MGLNMETNSVREWKSGPPPHVGWWNASTFRYESLWSWWDGEMWSSFVMDNMDETYAGSHALRREYSSNAVFWNDYWPENARVPRVDPNQE